MSAKDRRQRHKEATRESILDAALAIARSDGWSAVTVRRVADTIEYTAPIIYEYFANKDALLEELQDRGFVLLTERLTQAAAIGPNSHERLLQVCEAYVAFAYERPELYQLMHGSSSASVSLEKTFERATPPSEIVIACLNAWARDRNAAIRDVDSLLEIAWAALHGLVSLEMLGRVDGGETRIKLLARTAIEALLSYGEVH